jgi:hypothetical protein
MLPGAVLLVFMIMILLAGTPVHASQGGLPCNVETVPEDDLASAALGLTRQGLTGPGNVQDWLVVQFDEFDLTLANCDHSVHRSDGQFATSRRRQRLVRTLAGGAVPELAVGTLQARPRTPTRLAQRRSRSAGAGAARPLTGSGARALHLSDAYNPIRRPH